MTKAIGTEACRRLRFVDSMVHIEADSVEPCSWDKYTCYRASENGHFDCLKYLHENNCPLGEWICAVTAQSGNLNMVINEYNTDFAIRVGDNEEPITLEVEMYLKMTYAGDPGKTYGPPENCYPPEDPEWELDEIILRFGKKHKMKIRMDDFIALFGQEFFDKHYELAEDEAIAEEEIDRAKVGLKSSLIMQSESSSSRASSIGGDHYMLGRVRSLDEIKEKIEATSAESVLSFLRNNLYL